METSRRDRSWLAVLGLWALFVVPFAIALAVLLRPRWYPVLDLAQTELRIRDVPTGTPPLVGLPGRIGNFLQGSHPGPVSFWSLWPFYRLFGATSWAMEAAAAALNLLAIGAALWLAHRRGGTVVLVAVGTVVAALAWFYGPSYLTQPWNPYMPMMWFLVFALAVWSVLCEDHAALPLGVFAGTFCVQTHISYAALVAGLGGIAVVGIVWSVARARDDRGLRRRALVWTAVSAGLGVLLWLPPVIQELASGNGNLTIVWEYFTDPPEDPIGIGRGVEIMLVHLDPWRLVAAQDATSGSVVPGLLLLTAWLGSVVVAWTARARPAARTLLRLDLVLGMALVLGAASIGRIFGFVWYYLMLWAWGLCALLLLAIGWTVVVVVGGRVPAGRRDRARTALLVGLAGLTGLFLLGFVIDAAGVDAPESDVAAPLRTLAPETVRALEAGGIPGADRDGRLLVTWSLTNRLGSLGYGLLLELERQGFDVGVVDALRVVVTPHRVLSTAEATATVHLAQGGEIEAWRATPGYEEVAYVDLRTAGQRERFARLRREVIPMLQAAGLDDIAALVDENLFVATFDQRNPPEVKRLLEEMLAIDQPAAVFVGPPTEGG